MVSAGTVWERLREYAATQSGTFTSQEAITWFARHYPGTNEHTLRVHMREASWNVGGRTWAATREPFLMRVDRGVFRRATDSEVRDWRTGRPGEPPGQSPGEPPGRVRTSGRPEVPSEGTVGAVGADVPGFEWHTEEHTQHLLVEWLTAQGWDIVRTANTASREPGIDVVAERDGEQLGIEVKGFPSRFYVTGPKKGLVKRSKPVEQAKKWFAHALVPAMRLRSTQPRWRSVICFPDFPVYRQLHDDTALSLEAAGIEMWLVEETGSVTSLC